MLNLPSVSGTLTNSRSITIDGGGELNTFFITANTGDITVDLGALLRVWSDFEADSGVVEWNATLCCTRVWSFISGVAAT